MGTPPMSVGGATTMMMIPTVKRKIPTFPHMESTQIGMLTWVPQTTSPAN
jgi:hypothetical protein